ncbi:hypothetical protein J1614_007729 [Plenodomus biglobosus]|nr:hypothetical protein J1614_007729 [Plenodomus biglobosus]
MKKVKVPSNGGEAEYMSKVVPATQNTITSVSLLSLTSKAVPQDLSRPASQVSSQNQRNTPKTDLFRHSPAHSSTEHITISTQSFDDLMTFSEQTKSIYNQMCRALLPLQEDEGDGPGREARKNMQNLWQKASKARCSA